MALGRELRRLFLDIKVDLEQVEELLQNDILKREVIEGDKPKEAQQRVKKATQKLARQAAKKSSTKENLANEGLHESVDSSIGPEHTSIQATD
jgi:hypothetical protein